MYILVGGMLGDCGFELRFELDAVWGDEEAEFCCLIGIFVLFGVRI